LWQITRVEKNLAYVLGRTLMEEEPALLAAQLLDLSDFLVETAETLGREPRFRDFGLETIGRAGDAPIYTGMIDLSGDLEPAPPIPRSQLIRAHFGGVVGRFLSRCPADITTALARLKQLGTEKGRDPATVETLSALLIGH
jgi:hypothetical protein